MALFAGPTKGLLIHKLLQYFRLSVLEPTDFRWIDSQGQALICVTKHALDDSPLRLRLHVARHMDLFFVNEQFCGWALLNPARFVVEAWEEADEEGEDAQFVALLYEYLTLLTDPFIEKMEDRDASMLDRLRDVYSRITVAYRPSKRYNALRAAVADKIDRFYDLEVN